MMPSPKVVLSNKKKHFFYMRLPLQYSEKKTGFLNSTIKKGLHIRGGGQNLFCLPELMHTIFFLNRSGPEFQKWHKVQ